MQLIVQAIFWLINLLNILILIRCVMSFLPQTLDSMAGRIVVTLTEPLLAPCRRLLDRFEFTHSLPLDFSPLLAFLLLSVIEQIFGFLLRL